MRVSVVQFKPEFGDVDKNTSKIFNYCENVDTDIIVFPELAFTGYDFKDKAEARSMAEEFQSLHTKRLQELSSDLKKIICSGFVEKIGDKVYNSAALCFPNKDFSTTYHKVHLFYRERYVFDESEKGFNVVKYPEMNINIGTMICYDWRFPEASRTLALKGADIILCPSNLVTTVWHISTPSRALENKVYLAIANRTGDENRNDNLLHFNGGSVIHSYNGTDMAKAKEDSEEVLTVEINQEKTRKKSFNELNDIFSDRRPQFYL